MTAALHHKAGRNARNDRVLEESSDKILFSDRSEVASSIRSACEKKSQKKNLSVTGRRKGEMMIAATTQRAITTQGSHRFINKSFCFCSIILKSPKLS
ncbi:hypothetical protein [Paracoccus sp. AS002]|uniref:hypothetical protein n=1 Tax=Paracoccus sp. AS002 TaxID=3019545 RepID=UPI0023E8CF76|nr:hypothetical protein [Paracoccus sp. AS002]MDF3906521.1 hypothetical protein [Paracoccus sp. AS002]